jgi:hypothetical protein
MPLLAFDGMTWETFEQDLDHRIEDLHTRVHRSISSATVSAELYPEGRRQ